MKKRSIYLLGIITLLLFPLPTFFGLYYLEGMSPWEILQFDRITIGKTGLGVEFGVFYACLALLFMQAKLFRKMPLRVENIVRSMNLSIMDCILISICAGVGEELLFRSGVQFYLGPILTSVIFVAIHGYLNPFNWRMSMYGLIVLPFILLLSFGLEEFGIWFCIGAHFSYDLVLFLMLSKKEL